MKLQEKLAGAVLKRYGMIPTWPVGHPLAVGDVISRTDVGIQVETTLASLLGDGGSPSISEIPTTDRIKLSDGIKVEAAANTNAAGQRARIGFTARASFVIVAEGGTLTEYDELWKVRKHLEALHKAGRWDRSWQLVTSVRSADACTVLVSDKAGVRAEARLRPGLIAGDLLDVIDVGSDVSWNSDGGLDSVAKHCTPLHRALWIERRFGGKVRTTSGVRIEAGGHEAEAEAKVDVKEVGPVEAGLADEAADSSED